MGLPKLTRALGHNGPAASAAPLDDEWITTVRAIVSGGMWCVVEACTDVADQRWEPVLLVCSAEEETVSGALAAWIDDVPADDLRVCGYTRDTMRRVDESPSAICYLAAPA
jgi:hypothetical protein